MAHRRSLRWLGRGIAATALGAMLLSALPAQAAPWWNRTQFANESFQNVWKETDSSPGDRSLTWGPRPWWDYREFYKQSPNGTRQVQYFDKARMEINKPSATQDRFYVTNGLLPVEMVSGRLKLGDANSEDQYEQRASAQIPVAGDLLKVNPDAPTYAAFRLVATTSNDNRAPQQLGQRISTTFDKSGNIGARAELATAETEIVSYNANTGHNVPAVFKTYMDFYDRPGGLTALFAFGYPITEPYWVRARVGGQEKDVMVQMFERRVLTFTPTNPAQYQVEMGNVGQHYFQWRYANQGTPWDAETPYLPLAFASNRLAPSQLDVFTTDVTGAGQNPITRADAESLPFSMLRSWDKTQVRIIGDSKRETGRRQLYSFTLNGSDQRRIHTSTANDYNGAVSQDGSKIAFASDRDGNPEIFLLNLNGGAVAQLTVTAAPCVNEYPTWLPSGTGLAWHTNCTGNNYEIFRGDLSYTQDKGNDLKATLINQVNLTKTSANDRMPRIAPSGGEIAFRSDRDGNGEIYLMGASKGEITRRLTNSTGADDSAPSWSPDGSQIVYDSNAEGDYELYARNYDGTGGVRQLTDNLADDRWAIWGQ